MSAEPTTDTGTGGGPTSRPSVLVVVLGITGGRELAMCAAGLKREKYERMQVAYVAEREVLESDAAAAFGKARIPVESLDHVGAVANLLLDRYGRFDVVIFMRDDTIPDPGAVEAAAEAVTTTGAGVVGGKVVSAENPDLLVEVGLSADRFGVPYSRLEGIELDQQQYDARRQALFVSFSCLAVRGELVQHLGGFDEGIEGPGVELDFCWRVRLAGYDVIYVPEVRVRQVITGPLHEEHAALVRRNRLRLLFKTYGPLRLLSVGSQAAIATVFRTSAALLGGLGFQGARAELEPWTWNLRHLADLLKARRQAQRRRSVRDSAVTKYLVRGTALRLHRSEEAEPVGQRWRRGAVDALDRIGGRYLLLLLALVAFTLVAGRHLVFGDAPTVGKLVPPASSAIEVIGDYLGPWRDVDGGTSAAAPPGLAVSGLAGIITINSAAFVQKLFLLLGLPLAAVACSRSLRPAIHNIGARTLAAAVYALGPLWWNALAAGDLNVLAAAVLLPMAARRLAHLTGLGAYAEAVPPQRRKLELMILLAAGVAFEPAMFIAVVLIMVGWAVGAILVGGGRSVLQAAWALVQSAIGAFLLLLPWSFTLLTGSGASSAVNAVVGDHSFVELLRFDTGRFGSSVVGYGILAGALLPLLVVRGPRFGWATRWWGVAVVSFFAAWLVSRGVLPPLGGTEILLAPAALAFAYLVGWGLDGVRLDLPERTLSYVQPLTAALLVATALGLLSPLSALGAGRFGQPDIDWRTSLAWQVEEAKTSGEFRNLFVGAGIPGASRGLAGDLRFALAPPAGPTLQDLWLPPESPGSADLADITGSLVAGSVPNVGKLLAPFGVRYVIVPAGNEDAVQAVGKSLDLTEIQDDQSGVVFENSAWRPTVTGLREPVARKELTVSELASAPVPERFGTWDRVGRAQWTGATGEVVYAGVPFDDRFALETEEGRSEPKRAYGWALQFTDTPAGDGEIAFKAGPWRPLMVAVQVLLWALVLSGIVGLRGMNERRQA